MSFRGIRVAGLAAILLAPIFAAYAGTVHGTVKNGTTGKTAGGVEVILIQLQGVMQPVLNTKTDAQGQFTFDHPGIGAQPMLVRAVYHGVNFHTPLPPGRSELDVEVFDSSRDPKTVTVATHIVILQPNGSNLEVGEQYSITNNSQPPQAYFRADGDFDFVLPDQGVLKNVAAQGPSGMPVVQAQIDHGKNRYSIAYAFRPGENGVRYAYDLPYPGNSTTVKIATVYPGARLLVVAPPTVQISGEGLQASGAEQGMTVYDRGTVPANTVVAVNVSGTAPPPNTENAGGGGDSGGQGQGQDGQQGSSGVTIQQIPGRLDVLKWPVIIGLALIFGMLAALLARRPVVAVAGAPGEVAASPVAPTTKKAKSQPRVTPSAQATPPAPFGNVTPATPANMADVDAAVNVSLDGLKEMLFRLELRRQAGTISEEEYKAERARAEKVLRDLVRG